MASHLFVRAADHLVVGVRWSGFDRTGVDAAGVPVLTATAQARLVVLLPPQHVGEETSPEGSASSLPLPTGTAGGTVPGWRGVLSGGSRVAFTVAPGTRISLSAEGVLAAIANKPLVTSSGVPGADQTAVELPWRLLITPRGRSAAGVVVCRHSAVPVVSGQVSGMWQTRLVDASTPPNAARRDAGLTARAVDEPLAATPDPVFAPNTLPLGRDHRGRVVANSANRPATVERLELSALGGTLDATGIWPDFEWEHHAVLGRDMRVRTLAKGVLYPLGHRVQFLHISERVFDPAAGGAAVLRSTRVLTIVDPVRRPPGDGPLRRAFPMGDVEITTTAFAGLAPPPASTGSSPLTHFWPTTLAGRRVLFPIRCATPTGDVRFELPLLFVADLRPTFDSLGSPELARRLAADYGASKAGLPGATIDLTGSTHGADRTDRADGAGGERHEVHSITVAGVTGELDLRDGYRAQLTELELSLPALRVLRGDARLSTVRFAKKYLQNGAEDVFLEMAPGQVRDIDFTQAADKSGGLVAPGYVTNALSRTLGPVSLQALPNPVTGLIDPAALFPSDKATLLGFPLKSLLTQLKGPPEITSFPIPGSAPEVRMRWRDVALRSTGPFVAGPTTRLDLDITAAPGRNLTVCTLKNFALELPPGPKRVLRLSFRELTFTQRDGNAPDVGVSGLKAEFLGVLKLLRELQDAVDLGAAGKLVEVSTSGIKVRYSLPLPPIAAGAFVMRNIAFSAGIDIPFNGAPVGVALGFADRANPFQLSVMMFGGGGYVQIRLDRDGLKLFEAALEFGAFVAVDFLIASGEVHALGGVRFSLESGGAVTLTGYLRIGGCVEVLGLIAVSIELCLSMTYNSERNALVGRATLVIEIDLTLWSDSVEIDSGDWVLAGGRSDRHHPLDHLTAADPEVDAKADAEVDAAADAEALAQWRAYRAAFVDDGAPDGPLAAPPEVDQQYAEDRFRVVFQTTVRHPVDRVAWSPDDRWVAVGGPALDGTGRMGLTVLDAESGDIRWHVDRYTCGDIAVSPDGRRIAVGTFDGTLARIRLLDAGSGAELWNAPGSGLVSFSPDGALLGVVGTPNPNVTGITVAFVLDAATGALLYQHGRCLARPTFSSDSRLVSIGTPALLHSRTGSVVWQINEHEGWASACAFTAADDGVIMASGRFGTIIVYEPVLVAGAVVERSRVNVPGLPAVSNRPGSIRFSPDLGTVAHVERGHVAVNAVADGRVLFKHQTGLSGGRVSLSFRPDGSQLALNCSPTGQPAGIVVLDTATGSPAWGDAGPAVNAVAFSGDGARIAVGGTDFVRLYEVGRPVRARHDCGGPVTGVAVSAAAAGIVAAGAAADEPTLTAFRAATGEKLLERVHPGAIASIAVSPDGHSVATACADGRCRHFDTLTGTRWAARHGGAVNAVAFSSDSRWLVTGSSDRTARLFERRPPAGADPDDHQPRWARRHPQAVTHVALGPDLAWVATASSDRGIRILAADTGEELHAFEHDARIRALSANASGTLAAASEDGSASVIDAAAGVRRFRIEHPGPLGAAALNADGSLLATAGSAVAVWRIDGDDAVLLHRLTTRAPVTALAFDPVDGGLLIATEHPVVRIVDPLTGTETDRLIHREPVRHLVFGADGALLVTGCDDDHTRVYEPRHR